LVLVSHWQQEQSSDVVEVAAEKLNASRAEEEVQRGGGRAAWHQGGARLWHNKEMVVVIKGKQGHDVGLESDAMVEVEAAPRR
jgi:hypothetical protein